MTTSTHTPSKHPGSTAEATISRYEIMLFCAAAVMLAAAHPAINFAVQSPSLTVENTSELLLEIDREIDAENEIINKAPDDQENTTVLLDQAKADLFVDSQPGVPVLN